MMACHCQSLLLFVSLFIVSIGLSADVTLDQAVELVRNQQKGRVLSAETRRQNGDSVHVIKLLNKQGRVKQIRIDSTSGRRVLPKQRK